jgi:hypothetical protein
VGEIENPSQQQQQQQQQQQHSLLSQASWGRLEMKPKRDEKQGDTERDIKGTKTERGHGSGTLIDNLQALLSIAKSLETDRKPISKETNNHASVITRKAFSVCVCNLILYPFFFLNLLIRNSPTCSRKKRESALR